MNNNSYVKSTIFQSLVAYFFAVTHSITTNVFLIPLRNFNL